MEGRQRNRSLESVIGKGKQRERDRRFGGILGRGTAKQKFRECIGKGE